MVFRLKQWGVAVSLTFLANWTAPVAQAFDLSEAFRFPGTMTSETLNQQQGPALPYGLQCVGFNHNPLPFMNQIVLNWKVSTRDQWMSRALVMGPITQLYPDHTGHSHFGIDLSNDGAADLEVIYSEEFGALPRLNIGMRVAACGDYITVGPHAHSPSPLGAIIHWVHYNPGTRDGGRHPHGFLIINNQVYGYPVPPAGRR